MDNRKKILLVEDEVAINELYAQVLESAGFEVKAVFDGIQGLAAAQDKPDLILLDIMMPKMNGIEVLQRLKELDVTKHIPVVLLTNLGQPNIVEEAFGIGAQGYLLKVRINPEQLVEFAKKFIENPRYQMDFAHLNLD